MSKYIRTCWFLLTVIALSACSFSGPPKREVYTGKDQVGQISKDMIVGNWEVTILNPIEGEQADYKPIAHYSADGTLTMDAKFDTGGMGEMALEVSGTWQIEGDKITQVAKDVREKSGGSMAMMVKLFKGMMLRNGNANLNVYEASASRLLMVSDDGQAQELNRVK